MVASKEDLFYLPRDDQEWVTILKHVEFRKLNERKVIKSNYDQVMRSVICANAAISKSEEWNSKFMKNMMAGFGSMYYLVMQQRAMRQTQIFHANPEKDTALKVWTLGDKGLVKSIMPIYFPHIEYVRKIYFKQCFMRLDRDYLISQYESGEINNLNEQVGTVFGDDVKIPDFEELFIKKEGLISVRIVCYEELREIDGVVVTRELELISPVPKKGLFDRLFSKSPPRQKQLKDFHDTIIIHIHGGGFVSATSHSHQTYTRKWSNTLKVPVFSIEYRKAPLFPYPHGLDDCWQAYMWIINFIPQYFNVLPKKIIMTGDSAGGNLAAALVIMCIKYGVRRPDAILLSYPALNLDSEFFTPSILLSLDDGLLPHTFLKISIQAYIQDDLYNAKKDPFISPTLASDQILSQFPPCFIVVGDADSLHDECWRFGQKLIRLNRYFKMIVYPGMPHAFLSFDPGMKEATEAVDQVCQLLKQLIEQNF